MCRWNAYFGRPLLIDELLYRTPHGLIDQSLHAHMAVETETTNGDGFGLGWDGAGNGGMPGRYRSVTPAWSDTNLRDLALAYRVALVPRAHPRDHGKAERAPKGKAARAEVARSSHAG